MLLIVSVVDNLFLAQFQSDAQGTESIEWFKCMHDLEENSLMAG